MTIIVWIRLKSVFYESVRPVSKPGDKSQCIMSIIERGVTSTGSQDISCSKFKHSKTDKKPNCVLSCCLSCMFCQYTWATTKERSKTQSLEERNKTCQRCILSRSVSFCPKCSKCPQCCNQSQCGRLLTKVLANMGKAGRESKCGFHFEGGLCPTFQNEAPSHQVTSDLVRLCKPGKEPVSQRGIASSDRQVGCRKSGCPFIPSLLQPVISSPKTQQQMETNFGPQSAKPVSKSRYLQNGNTGDNPVISKKKGVGNVTGLQRHVFPHSHQSLIKKIPEVFPKQTNLSIHCPSLWFSHSYIGV